MASAIIYTSYLGDVFSNQKFDDLTDYNINYYEDNVLRKIEHFRNEEISRYTVYLLKNEEPLSILNEYGKSPIDLINRDVAGAYRIEETSFYEEKILLSFSKQLYDQQNNLLCHQDYDLVTMQPDFYEQEKYLYTTNEGEALGFSYLSDGSIDRIWGGWVLNTDQRQRETIYREDIPIYFPTLFLITRIIKMQIFHPRLSSYKLYLDVFNL